MTAYYNEIDPFAAEWIKNLINANLIAPGDVDTRSIRDVRLDDLRPYTQCHFFAGIGVWSYALRRSGWGDDSPVWTGSCPCQPFSAAGKQSGTADDRHLWPAWFNLIRECRPPVVFGEQVASAIRHGWLDLVRTDLEGAGYACGASVLGAHSTGAPHIRQRLWFVAQSDSQRCGKHSLLREEPFDHSETPRRGETGIVADSISDERRQIGAGSGRCGEGSGAEGLEQRPLHGGISDQWKVSQQNRSACETSDAPSPFWSDCDWIPCRDGKWRPTQPGLFPLAHGATQRVGRLRAYGNAIVAETAMMFIRASMVALRP